MKSWLKTARTAPQPTKKKLEIALREILDERAQTDVISSGFISHFSIVQRDNRQRAVITLELPGGPSPQNEALADLVERAANLPGIDEVQVIKSAHRHSITVKSPQNPSESKLNQRKPASGSTASGSKISLPKVKHIITIASGKGGVGKSTIAANIAIALAQAGHRVGVMDADIYGPSLPVLFGLTERAQAREGRLQPIEKFGLSLMSIGVLLDESQALAWRGPMVMGAVRQLLSDVEWGELDYLVIDTPPGTGDAHLTLLQSLPISGTIIISTPQKMALADVRRGITLFRKMSVPVLGLIENMAWLETEDNKKVSLFGPPRGAHIAEIENIPIIGTLPVLPALAAACDMGRPLAMAAPQSPIVQEFAHIARMITEKLIEAKLQEPLEP